MKSWLVVPDSCCTPAIDTSVPEKLKEGTRAVTGAFVGSLAEKVLPSRANSISSSRSGFCSLRREKLSKTGSAGGGGGGGVTTAGSEEPPDPPPHAVNNTRVDITKLERKTFFWRITNSQQLITPRQVYSVGSQ